MKCGIIGCGYVGTELAWQLTTNGHDVVGVRRSQSGVSQLQDAGYQAVQADVTDPDSLHVFPSVDIIVYAVSPGRTGNQTAQDVYQTGLENTLQYFLQEDNPPRRFFYTSSTGVYGNHDGNWVDESTTIEPVGDRQAILIDAEETIFEHTNATDTTGTVIRFGGIYGPNRGRLQSYLEGPVTDRYTNLIHRDDAAGIIRYLIETSQCHDDIVNGVDDSPVSKWEIARWIAATRGENPPEKQTIADRLESIDTPVRRERIAANKRCSNEKLLKFGYRYKYPTFRDGYTDIIDSYFS
jgi:nucleoside-diphosphate-sugar epimerase